MRGSPKVPFVCAFCHPFLIVLLALSSASWASPKSSSTGALLLSVSHVAVPKDEIGQPLDRLVFPAYQSADVAVEDRPRPAKLQSAKLVFHAFQQPEPDDGARRVTASIFPNWTRVMHLQSADRSAFDCGPGAGADCPLADWQAFLDGIRHKDLGTQLKRVNDFVNRFAYRSDESNWDRADYWAAPAEFFNLGGDCEDFAIAKFFSLKRLGVPTDAMRIVVLRDDKRQTDHAVLTVEHEGETLMLDSVERAVLPWHEVRHYRPYFSVNDRYFWLHTTG